jgi:hypothetical protein
VLAASTAVGGRYDAKTKFDGLIGQLEQILWTREAVDVHMDQLLGDTCRRLKAVTEEVKTEVKRMLNNTRYGTKET